MNHWLKFLTLSIALTVFSAVSFASDIDLEDLSTHLRLTVRSQEEALKVEKGLETVTLKTLSKKLFNDIQASLKDKKLNSRYIKSIDFIGDQYPSKPLTVAINMQNPSIEAFTFFRKADGKHIVDFWINTDLVQEKKSSVKKKNAITKKLPANSTPKITNNIKPNKDSEKNFLADKDSILKPNSKRVNIKGYRDFRYGANFIWPYKAMIPEYKKDFDITKKTPDYLYPIKDREYTKDQKESHMQLTINLYRKEKWGHLNKSLRLYEKKYGSDANRDLNELIKISALLKDNIKNKDKNIHKTAMTMLSNLAEATSDYRLKVACYRYLIQNAFDKNNNITILDYAKKLYVISKVEIDDENSVIAINAIMHSLAKMNQLEQLEKFIEEKTVQRVIPKQISLGYQSYIYLVQSKYEDLRELYNGVKKSLVKPIASAILFNVAEAHFQLSEFDEAITQFDTFLKEYNHLSYASYARIRLALSYDFLDKKQSKVLELYAQAINRSALAEARYEAKLRYVGLRVARKIEPAQTDFEHEVFLEPTDDEKAQIQGKLKRLMWLTRLRVLLVKGEYSQALTYFDAIPIDSLPLDEKKIFVGDGREALLGNLKSLYEARKFGEVVKSWELQKDTIGSELIRDPYAGQLILTSYLNLGLDNHFKKYYEQIKKARKAVVFPKWVKRDRDLRIEDVVKEVNIKKYIADKKYDEAQKEVLKLDSKNFEIGYFKGKIHFHLKEYQQAIKEFEQVLVKDNILLGDSEKEDLAMTMLESLYRSSKYKRFKVFADAFKQDLIKIKDDRKNDLLERIDYLYIEVMAADGVSSKKKLVTYSRDFVRKFKTSNYQSRVKYILGSALVSGGQKDEAKEVFTGIIKDDKSPTYIKEQAKSELAELELEKSL